MLTKLHAFPPGFIHKCRTPQLKFTRQLAYAWNEVHQCACSNLPLGVLLLGAQPFHHRQGFLRDKKVAEPKRVKCETLQLNIGRHRCGASPKIPKLRLGTMRVVMYLDLTGMKKQWIKMGCRFNVLRVRRWRYYMSPTSRLFLLKPPFCSSLVLYTHQRTRKKWDSLRDHQQLHSCLRGKTNNCRTIGMMTRVKAGKIQRPGYAG